MKHFLLLALLTVGFNLKAQQTITFRDGKTHVIKGKKIGSNFNYAFDDPTVKEKLIEYYWLDENGVITLTEYSSWLKADILGRMDELRTYHFKLSDLENTPTIEEETDDNDQFLCYSLNFKLKDETFASRNTYNIYSSVPSDTRNMSSMNASSIDKSAFEELIKE